MLHFGYLRLDLSGTNMLKILDLPNGTKIEPRAFSRIIEFLAQK